MEFRVASYSLGLYAQIDPQLPSQLEDDVTQWDEVFALKTQP